MKLGICCNFGPGIVSGVDQVGGSEMVIKHISTRLIKNLGYEISVFAFNYDKKNIYEGINIVPCQKGENFISQINEMDHLMVYSDSFWEWETILRNIDRIKPDVTISMVGMYYMTTHSEAYKLFRGNINRYRIITHSKGKDYAKCVSDGLTVNVAPNGVDLAEFEGNTINFREKYNIKEKYIFLNVSNYFYGKGQENLGKISRELRKVRDDFIFVSISSSIEYPHDKTFLNRAKKEFSGDKCLFLRDIPRDDVIAAYKHSDVFVFTSLKEVAPLVMWEARAAKLPWVASAVGDVCSHKDGKVFVYCETDKKGHVIVDDYFIQIFARFIGFILYEKRELEHYEEVIQHDWSKIYPLYDEVFKK